MIETFLSGQPSPATSQHRRDKLIYVSYMINFEVLHYFLLGTVFDLSKKQRGSSMGARRIFSRGRQWEGLKDGNPPAWSTAAPRWVWGVKPPESDDGSPFINQPSRESVLPPHPSSQASLQTARTRCRHYSRLRVCVEQTWLLQCNTRWST